MAKNKVSEWSSTPANNTDIGGINIAEGCAPSGINNAIREMMAQVKDMQSGTDADNFTIGGNLSVTGDVSLTNELTVPNGGTGVSSVTTGDILYASNVDTFSKLAGAGTTGSVMLSGVSAPSWGKVPMNTHVSGVLPVANGGTGVSTLTTNSVLIGNGTSAVSSVAPSTSGNVLSSNGTNWASVALSSLGEFDKSLTTNGYQKLPGGLMIQWGTYNSTSDDPQTFTWTYAFPNGCFAAITNFKNEYNYPSLAVNAVTATTFTLNRDNGVDGTQPFYIIAIGY